MPPPAELLIPRENNLRRVLAKRWPQKIKRAGPSHKPHPKATCPHPTRPLRPPGRRARDDYAQVTLKMQPKLYVFSMFSKGSSEEVYAHDSAQINHSFVRGKTASIL